MATLVVHVVPRGAVTIAVQGMSADALARALLRTDPEGA